MHNSADSYGVSPDQPYDVIVVGGRPSGSTLAARLGQAGLRVLLLDRSAFPSLPAVSSPIIYSCTMQLLDEIGADEADYARDTPKIRRIVTEAGTYYRGTATLPDDNGRNYAYALDRARFDDALWRTAAASPNVTAFSEFSVTDLLFEPDSDRVIGIVGKPKNKPIRSYYARTVVGADGRFSMVARKVDAPMYNEHEGKSTSLYYAYWRGLAPYDIDEPLMMTHGSMDGFGYLMMDSADGTTAIVAEGFTETFDQFAAECGIADGGEALYTALLKRAPRIWSRLQNAERVTTVRGLRHTPNYYRQVDGAGWALVGDAVHHKDPLGGQGIYDAVFSAKILANNLIRAHRGEVTMEQAMRDYKAELEAETLPMYEMTKQATANFAPQGALQRWLGRYAAENTEFMEQMLKVPSRMSTPTEVMNPKIAVETLVKGVTGDARRLMTGESRKSEVPPLPSEQTEKRPGNLGCLGWALAIPAVMFASVFFGARNR
jgi:flavin-dependent dehydrogenase